MSSETNTHNGDGSSQSATLPAKSPHAQSGKSKPRALPPYHVVLLDDQDHTHEYVMEMMGRLFGYPPEQGYRIAQEVATRMKAVVFTTHKELAELKRDQIHAYGTDIRVATCAGSMSACIVAAEA